MAEVSTIPAYVLANENLLMWLLKSKPVSGLQEGGRDYLREFVYVDFHRWNDTQPDHVFRHRWECFCHEYIEQKKKTELTSRPFRNYSDILSETACGPKDIQDDDAEKEERAPEKPSECSLVLACMECLKDEYIEVSRNELHVRMSHFGWWQNMLSRMSALPVVAHARWRFRENVYGSRMCPKEQDVLFRSDNDIVSFAADGEIGEKRKVFSSMSTMLYPYDAGVENHIALHGLNDSHLHVNLAAGPEICWLHALLYTDEEWRSIADSFGKMEDVVELFREIHTDLTPQMMIEHATTAKRLRYLLKAYAWDEQVEKPGANSASQKKNGSIPEYVSVLQCLAMLSNTPPEEWTEQDVRAALGRPECIDTEPMMLVPDVAGEAEWLARVLRKQAENPNRLVERILHLYILLTNEFVTFSVQRDNFKGFKQFQKYTYVEKSIVGREFYYEQVFYSLHGPSRDSMTNYAELRIAPKDTEKGNMERIGALLNGYLRYVRTKNREVAGGAPAANSRATADDFIAPETPQPGRIPVAHTDWFRQLLDDLRTELQRSESVCRLVRPVIVLHLIKFPWNRKKTVTYADAKEREKAELNQTMRYGYVRESNRRKLDALKELFTHYADVRQWVCGIDAAAYELDTPPDVFSVAYRRARLELGIPHATYHTGEDFYHLVSGIRTVWETVDLLGFQRGDRIGHATALGVDPELWMRTMPGRVAPTCGDWLQDLVFAWNLLRISNTHGELQQRLEYDIRDLAYKIFQLPLLPPYILGRVFALRNLDVPGMKRVFAETKDYLGKIREVNDIKNVITFMKEAPKKKDTYFQRKEKEFGVLYPYRNTQCLEDFDRELEKIFFAIRNETEAIMRLAYKWQLDAETWKRSEERLEVPTDYFSADELVLLQQLTMRYLSERGIVIETLPTSNLRISQYKEMGQHHSLRWLGVGIYEGDNPPPIVLGTDDPGVFATDIKAEFYHLFASLCKRGLNAQDALEKLVRMDQCGNRYAFRRLAGNSIA